MKTFKSRSRRILKSEPGINIEKKVFFPKSPKKRFQGKKFKISNIESASDAQHSPTENTSDKVVSPKLGFTNKSHNLSKICESSASDRKSPRSLDSSEDEEFHECSVSESSGNSTISTGTPTSISFLAIEDIRKRIGSPDCKVDIDKILEELSRLRIHQSEMETRERAWNEMLEIKNNSLLKLAKQFAASQENLREKDTKLQNSINERTKLESRILILEKDLAIATARSKTLSGMMHSQPKKSRESTLNFQQKSYRFIAELSKRFQTNKIHHRKTIASSFDGLQMKSKGSIDDQSRVNDANHKEKFYAFIRVVTIFLLLMILIAILLVAIFKRRMPPIFISSLCAPTPPGTILSSALPPSLSLIAPWWVPPILKPTMFRVICEFENSSNQIRPRTKIEWKGNKNRKDFVVSKLLPYNKVSKSKDQRKIYLKKTAKSVIIHADYIELFNGDTQGSSIILDAPWHP